MGKYEATFSLEFILKKIILKECLLCETKLDKDLGGNWHIPLCRKHRNEYLEGIEKELGLKSPHRKPHNPRFKTR
jgi:hypothetical protein